MERSLRDEALLILDKRGAILDIARDLSRVMREEHFEGAVIGGVAVVLHGYVRTTVDVDLWMAGPLGGVADALAEHGYGFDAQRREFIKSGVPVHLVTSEQIKRPPRSRVDVEGITTIDLASLIDMKLRSGLSDPLRAQDLADVIGLIRCNRLSPAFASQLEAAVRPEFRKLARSIAREEQSRGS